jgi:hypothetical protein
MDKNFTPTPFGNGYGHKVSNPSITNHIINKLEKYRLQLFTPFNKTYQLAKDKHDFKEIKEYEHLVNYWINAPLSYLYLTTYSNIPFVFYITQTSIGIEIFSTIQKFCPSLFTQDTLFEGYLINTSESIFLVDDIVIYHDQPVNINLEHRLKLMNDILDYKYQPDPVLDTHRVILKDYVEYSHIKSLFGEYLMQLTYQPYVIGLVFSPLGNCMIHIRVDNTSIIHYDVSKPNTITTTALRCTIVENPKKNLACFRVTSTNKPDVYELYLKEGYYDIASVPDNKTSTMLQQLFQTCKECIMICNYDERDHMKRWIPHIVSNRSTPDSIICISTLSLI